MHHCKLTLHWMKAQARSLPKCAYYLEVQQNNAYSVFNLTLDHLFCALSQECSARGDGENFCCDRIISKFTYRSHVSSLVYSSVTSACCFDVLA